MKIVIIIAVCLTLFGKVTLLNSLTVFEVRLKDTNTEIVLKGATMAKDDKGKGLKDLFTEQQKQINEMLDGSFKEKLEAIKGHPKMNEIRDKSKQYCERLFDALKFIVNESKNKMNNYRDYLQRADLERLYRDVERDRKKCQYRFVF